MSERSSVFNVLPPAKPAQQPLSRTALVSAWVTVIRPDFAVAISVIVVGIIGTLAYRIYGFNEQFAGAVVLGLIVWWAAHSIGAGVNSCADYETDRLDTMSKARLSQAIDRVGSASLWRIVFIETIGATLLIAAASVFLSKPLLLLLWVIGLPLGVFYSVEPVRFKRRGIFNTLSVAITVFIIPMLFMAQLFFDVIPPTLLILIVIYGIQTMSFSIGDQLLDFEFDAKTGVQTLCVVIGRVRATWLALLIFISSAGALMLLLYNQWPADRIGLIALSTSLLLSGIIIGNFLILLWLGYKLADAQTATPALVTQYKRHVRTPLWLALSGLSVMIALTGIVVQ